jgi:hypothetical protein
MSLCFASEQLADLRHHAQRLIERAGDHEGQLAALVASAEGDVRQAEAAVSHAAHLPARTNSMPPRVDCWRI